MNDWPIWQTAYRHDVSEDSIRHALRNRIGVFDQPDGMTMHIGPDYDGTPLEVGTIRRNGVTVIIHADRPARPKYLR